MKNIIVVVLTIVLVNTVGFAQSKTPSAVTTAFNKKFNYATNVKWDKENDHEYEAEFVLNGGNWSANFSNEGEWLETEKPITFNQLPEKVKTAFNNNYKDAKVKAVAQIESSKGGFKFEVEIKQLLLNKEVFYDLNGKELEKED